MDGSIILGIDPGTRVTGYGLIVQKNPVQLLDFGAVRPPSHLPLYQRYHLLYENMEKIIVRYQPHILVVEGQFMQKNVQSAIKLGMAKGIAYLLAAKYQMQLFEYSPKEAKLAVVGTGSASKHQVQKMIQMLFSLQELPQPEDATDALSLAICHHHKSKWKRL
jgi:crossover junction endodeoxyribonuclease RuvC